jgi:hypothetical protein
MSMSTPHRRRWFQFGLAGMLMTVMVLASAMSGHLIVQYLVALGLGIWFLGIRGGWSLRSRRERTLYILVAILATASIVAIWATGYGPLLRL